MIHSAIAAETQPYRQADMMAEARSARIAAEARRARRTADAGAKRAFRAWRRPRVSGAYRLA